MIAGADSVILSVIGMQWLMCLEVFWCGMCVGIVASEIISDIIGLNMDSNLCAATVACMSTRKC